MFLSNYVKQVKRYLNPLVVFSICGYALYLRLIHLSTHLSLWLDEDYQVARMHGSFMDMLRALPQTEYCPYLSGDYYLIYPFFKIFSFNKWGLAIPHIIATIVGFYLLYLICRRYFKTIWGYIITFTIVCFNSNLIIHATEIRAYAVFPTLALACLYLSLKLVDQNINMSLNKKWAIGTFFVLTIWFHVYGILILFCSLAFPLLTKIKDKNFKLIIKDLAKLLSVVFIVAMPLWLISVFGPHTVYNRYNTFQYIPSPFKNVVGFLKSVFGNLIGRKQLYFLLLGIILPFIVPYKKRFQQMVFLALAVIMPIGLILLSSLKNEHYFLQRYFVWVMPFFAFFLGWSWDSSIGYIRKKLVKQ